MIAIVNYGSGNIQAIKNIYTKLRIDSFFASKPGDLRKASKIILPGVGSFDQAMAQLNQSGMRDELDALVLEAKKPVLGVCVGMQIMANCSQEGVSDGLGWFDARVESFDVTQINHKPKIPHMGWNDIHVVRKHCILEHIDEQKGFYFLHSYFFHCNNERDVLAKTFYSQDFACAVNRENIFGFQFHPEKSHSNGVSLFKNFAGINV
ncbi:MAG: imidazole glycerol phosphate synthase subunit HisH [Oceanospirillaceae bacterium]|nr:imidazole glycerol phosphate synthase subunit HisH [Oceanospirillaceae bacterium]